MSEYVATAAAEKRLREILTGTPGEPGLTDNQIDIAVDLLTGEGVMADYKPRLKAVLLTVPMPDTNIPRPTRVEPAVGDAPTVNVPPELIPEAAPIPSFGVFVPRTFDEAFDSVE